ncbi:hypothetical protein [Streptomyces sp. cg35]|uniref:hypothetical protein n=1 Tax=Streptomyces sp. cg35 TaxID=3421650 RepID=UPI003D1700DF
MQVRYTTAEDVTDYNATGERPEVLVLASVAAEGVTAGHGWMLAEWTNPYRLADALTYAMTEAVDDAERRIDAMAAELAQIRFERSADAAIKTVKGGDDMAHPARPRRPKQPKRPR